MARLLVRLVALCLVALCIVGPAFGESSAHAQPSGPQEPPYALRARDVGVVAEPSVAKLPPLPSDFQRIDNGWLVLEFPTSVRERVEPLAREAEDFRARLSADFGQPVLGEALVRLARTPDQMAELAPIGSPPPAYASGVAYPSLHLALLALQAPATWEAPDLLELLRHELAHLGLSDALRGRHVPRWLDEGLAVHESGELRWSRWKALADASLSKRLLPFETLDDGFPSDTYAVSVAYAESADFVRFLMRDSDRARFGSLLARMRSGTAFDRALEDAYGTDLRKLEYEWREEVSHRFGWAPLLTGGGLLWALIAGLSVVAWARRRRLAKAKLAEWEREEAAMAMAAAVPALPERPAVAVEEAMPPRFSTSVPIVEHDGHWYTLH
ncbi:MAG: peptidase MA family metallohydrolase [Myxococcota bacterium]|nr:peptidase MA family metallohydrolase [Myxococcota bacterium]